MCPKGFEDVYHCMCNIHKKIALPSEFIFGDLATVI